MENISWGFKFQVNGNNMIRKSLNLKMPANPGGKKELRLVLIALLCVGLVFGCAQIRKVTYPRDFVYLERKQLRSKMALLSFNLRQLDEVLADDSTVGRDRQQNVLEILKRIEASTAELGGGVTTNHLVIDDHIDQFKTDVSTAIYDARADPPNYFAAGRLIGSCLGCHKFRDY